MRKFLAIIVIILAVAVVYLQPEYSVNKSQENSVSKKILESTSEEKSPQEAVSDNKPVDYTSSEPADQTAAEEDEIFADESLAAEERHYSAEEINLNSDLARSYGLKILPVMEKNYDGDIWVKYDVANLKNESVFLLTTSGETVEMVYKQRKFMKLMNDRAYFYLLVNKADPNKKMPGEFIVIGKKEIANDVKYSRVEKINDDGLTASVQKLFKEKYDKKVKITQLYPSLRGVKGKSYEFGTTEAEENGCNVKAIFMRDSKEKKISLVSSIESSECSKDNEEVTYPQDMLLREVTGVLSIKGEDWVTFVYATEDGSGFAAVRYLSEGRFDVKSSLVNEYYYYGNL